MKQFITGVLCCLLLCGCSAAPEPTGTASETEASTAPAGFYAPGSALEQQYHGAVLAYPLGRGDAHGLFSFEDKLLLMSGDDVTTLTLLEGDMLSPTAVIELAFFLAPEDPSLVIREKTLSFYDPVSKETVVLDGQLQPVRRIPAPDGLSGKPILSHDGNRLYYCSETALMVWDLEADLRRMVKEMAYPAQSVTGLHCDGTVVQCTTGETNLFLSGETGTLIRQWDGPIALTSESKTFQAAFRLGLMDLLVWDTGAGAKLLLPENLNGNYLLLSPHPGVVRIAPVSSDHIQVEYYTLENGIRSSVLALAPEQQPIAAAYSGGYVYLLCQDAASSAGTILRWDLAALASNDATVYQGDYATDVAPQEEAMARCDAYAKALSRRYGISVHIGSDAAARQPWDYELEAEMQPALILRQLEQLDAQLAGFPAEILTATASNFSSLNLCLVRSVTGTSQSGALGRATGVQFLDGTDAYVVIAAGPYSEQALCHELFHAMETHIFNFSIAFDQWDQLNPAGFRYTYGHAANENRDSGIYLQPEHRSFVDAYSMSFPKEDRARIFEYAMLEGCRDLFKAPVLQSKLAAICDGIRQAYDLEDDTASFPWEQYLQ